MQTNIHIESFTLSDEQADFLDRQMPRVVTSDGKVKPFEGNRIKNSMLDEIKDFPENIAEAVTVEVSKSLLGHEIVTAPMIRELVCGVLYRLNPKWRFQYTRLGIPFFNFKNQYGPVFDNLSIDWRAMTREDVLNNVIPMINPYDLCELVMMIGKDYLGVKDSIDSSDGESEDEV